MVELILIGGGGHCKSCIDVIENTSRYKISGILDKKENVGKNVLGYKVIGTDDKIPELIAQNYSFVITVGQIKSPEARQKLFKLIKSLNGILPVVISPLAYVSPYAKIEEGTIVMHHALVNADSQVGRNCIINSHALIEHDTIIEDHCHISTGAIINGGTRVGEGSFIGSNSVTREYIEIESGSFVKANSLVK